MTIYDIAKEANVSISTVSRVLNTPERVSPAMREKVEAILKKHNYVPSTAAQALVNRSLKSIGVLVPDIRNLHFSTAAYYLETLFSQMGYSTLLCNTGNDNNMTKKVDAIRILASRRIDALVMLGSVFSNIEIEKIVASYLPKTPIIASNASLTSPNCYSVELDHSVGMELAISHLIDRGFDDIYFVQANTTLNTQRKIDGFRAAAKAHGLPFDPDSHIFSCAHGPEGGRDFVRQNVSPSDRRKAYIFMDDYTAVGAVGQLRKMGIDIPGQVGIVGEDNSVFAVCCEPQLTTIDTKINAISNVISTTLYNIFMGAPVGDRISIRPGLIVRETT